MNGSDQVSYTSSFSLKGKVSVVTGATGILGRHFCRGLAESGSNVVVVDLKKNDVESFAKEISEIYDVQCIGIACDISKQESVTSLVEQVVKDFERIDILHNNAATKSANVDDFFVPTSEFDMQVWREIMSVNLDGMFLVAREIGSRMVQQGGGSIIQTSSIYGVTGVDQSIYEGSEYMGRAINTPAIYSASKAGVVGLSKYLATLWGKEGVRVNTLVPGGVFSGQNDQFVSNYSRRVPMSRMAEAKEMVGALLFLASDASSYITGQTLCVDGGLTSW